MAGTNLLPVALADTASISVDGPAQISGDVLTNDSDPDGDPIAVTAVNGLSANVGQTLTGTYGSLVLGANGQYTYVLAAGQANVQALGAGQTVTDVFHYTISDGVDHSTTTTTVHQNLLTQSEAFDSSAWVRFADSGSAPVVTANVAAGPQGGANTADQIVLSGADRGIFYATNVSGQYTFSIWVRLVSGNGNFAFNYYDGADGEGTKTAVATGTWQRFSWTFNGTGNPDANVALIHAGNQTGSGTFQLWGAQINPGAVADLYVPTTGAPASVTTTTVVDPPPVTADLTVSVHGPAASGGSNAPPVAVADSASVTVNAATQASGNVLANDSDPDGNSLTVATVNGAAASVGAVIAGTYGSLVLGANGQYSYVLAANQANVRALAPGQTVTDVFHYTISDGYSHTTTTNVTNQNLISQSEAFDSAPWVKFAYTGSSPTLTANVAPGPQGGASTADQIVLNGINRGVFYVTPVTGQHTFSVWVKLVSGDGRFDLNYYDGDGSHSQASVATGAWQRFSFTFNGTGSQYANVAIIHDGTQSGNGTFQIWGAQLNPGATPDDYVATTGTPLTVTTPVTTELVVGADLAIAVHGPAVSVDAAPIAVGDHADVSVVGPTQASGNVLANDSAPSGAPLSVTAVNGQAAGVGTTITGTYGTLTLGANGQYNYNLATGQANVQALAPAQTVTDTFHYTVSDGAAHAQTTSVLTGQNLILQSEAFNDSSWVRFSYTGSAPTVTANVAPGPQGGASTADQIALNGVNRGVYYATPLTGQNTFSVWVKLASGDGHFDLNYYDGSASHSLAGVATGTWQRFSLTFNGTGSQYANVAIMHDGTQSGSGTFQIWGAQLNPGALPGDYAVTKGHFNAVFTDVTSSAPPTADLTINVSGGDPAAVAPNTLSFAGGTQSVAVNLGSGTWAHALRVMPLGDSITYGWTDIDYQQGQTNAEDGYRGPLWWNFQANSMLVDMVGPNMSGDIYLPDHDHAGYPNYRSDQISALLPGLLAANHPDAILLMAGTNDIFQEAQPAQHVADSITDMIETVRQMSPSTHLYVATLMPINQAKDGEPGDAAMVATVNAAIATAVSQAIAAGDNVSLVDMSGMTLSDIADAAHPTTDGYAKLAQIWYNAILAQQPNNGGTPGGASHVIAANVHTVIGSEGSDLLIGNALAGTLNGGGGNDRLVSVSASDVLTGGSGADLFDFSPASGHVTITDFSRAQGDHIELDSFSGLTQFSQLAGHISVSGTTTTIDLSSFGSHTVIDLAHFSGSLSASDFWLW